MDGLNSNDNSSSKDKTNTFNIIVGSNSESQQELIAINQPTPKKSEHTDRHRSFYNTRTALAVTAGITAINATILIDIITSGSGSALGWLFLTTIPLNLLAFISILITFGLDVARYLTSTDVMKIRVKSLFIGVIASGILGPLLVSLLYWLYFNTNKLERLQSSFDYSSDSITTIFIATILIFAILPVYTTYVVSRKMHRLSASSSYRNLMFGSFCVGLLFLLSGSTFNYLASRQTHQKLSNFTAYILPDYDYEVGSSNGASGKYGRTPIIKFRGVNNMSEPAAFLEMKATSSNAKDSASGLCTPSTYIPRKSARNKYQCKYEFTSKGGVEVYKGMGLTYYFVINGTFIEYSGAQQPENIVDTFVIVKNPNK